MTPRDPSNATEPFDPQTLTADVRIELDGAPGDTQIDTNGGYPRYALEGTIVNLDANVTGSDGTCMPSLTSLADANPLDTSRGDRIRIMRVPSMHGAFDDVFTLDWPEDQYTNDMGSALFISTIALASPLPAWNPVQGSPHGTPWSGPSFDTAVVTGGGADCSL
jgi:hypothetical protein